MINVCKIYTFHLYEIAIRNVYGQLSFLYIVLMRSSPVIHELNFVSLQLLPMPFVQVWALVAWTKWYVQNKICSETLQFKPEIIKIRKFSLIDPSWQW